MKTRRFDFNFHPLQIDVSLSVEGSVPDRQNYDADTSEYTPDYTLTPLTLQPRVSRMDKDQILPSGIINSGLTNIRWYENVGGVSTLIGSDNTGYAITTSGDNAGRIQVKKNIGVGNPVTLELYAEYIDSRTGQVHIIQATHMVKCDNATAYIPVLLLNAADQTVYNPLADPDTQEIKASLRLGEDECPTDKRLFVWEVCRDGSTWSEIGEETTLDYPFTVSDDSVTCTVDRTLMGTEVYLRCRARYDIDGNPSSVELTDASPSKIISIVRRMPKYEYDFALPTNIPPGTLVVYPEPYIWDTNGTIGNPEKCLIPFWYIATNKQRGTLSYSQVAHGYSPAIPTTAFDGSYGAVINLDVVDFGPACCWEDSDDSLLEDSDGYLIMID